MAIAISLSVVALITYCLIRVYHTKEANSYTVYVGGYGFYAAKYSFNGKTLETSKLSEFKMQDPSYLSLSGEADVLYAVNENKKHSSVVAYRNSFTPQILSERRDIGWGPCFLTLGLGTIFTANYGDGSISVFPIDTSGAVKSSSQIVKFVTGRRRAKSAIHSVMVVEGPKTKKPYLVAADLWADKLYLFKIEQDTLKNRKLVSCDTAYFALPSGSGPRNLALSSSDDMVYLICQNSGQIMAFNIDEADGNLLLTLVQTIPASRYDGVASADVKLHPSGKFLYASNRKVHDGISIFNVEEEGALVKTAYQVTASEPRCMAISPDGAFMFVACQKGREVQIFKIDDRTGLLTNTGKSLSFSDLEPSCVVVTE